MNIKKQFYYETKKLGKNKQMILIEICAIALLLFGLIFMLYGDRSQGYTIAEGYSLWKHKGTFSDDISYLYKINQKSYNEDLNHYHSYLCKIIEDSKSPSLSTLFSQESTYDLENRAKTAATYEKLRGISVKPSYLWGMSIWLNGKWQSVLYLLITVLFSIRAFCGDSPETKMFIHTTQAGRTTLSHIQLLTIIWKITKIYLLSWCLSLLIVCSVTPIKSLTFPIQSIPGYLTCSLYLKIWQFLILCMGIKWIGLVSVILVIYLFCSILWRYLDAMLSCILFFFLQLEIYNNIGIHTNLAFFHYFNYCNLLVPEKMLSTYQNINLNGLCINTFTIWIIMVINMGVFCIGFGTYFHRKFIPNINKKTIEKFLQKFQKKLFCKHHKNKYYEIKLLFFISKALVFWIIFLALISYISYKERSFVDLNEYFYNYYANELQKASSKEQPLVLEKIQNEINQKIDTADASNMIIRDIQNNALNNVYQDLEAVNIIRNTKNTCTFLNQIPWKKLLNSDKLKENIILLFFTLLVLLLPTTAYCLYERKSSILSAFGYLPGMKKKRTHEIQVCCIYSSMIWLALFIKNLIPVVGKYELYGWKYPCSCLLFLPKWTNSLPIYGYYLLIQLTTLLLMMLIANLPNIILKKK